VGRGVGPVAARHACTGRLDVRVCGVDLVAHRLPVRELVTERLAIACANARQGVAGVAKGGLRLCVQAVEPSAAKLGALARRVHQLRSIETRVHGQTSSNTRVLANARAAAASLGVPRTISWKQCARGSLESITAGQIPWSLFVIR